MIKPTETYPSARRPTKRRARPGCVRAHLENQSINYHNMLPQSPTPIIGSRVFSTMMLSANHQQTCCSPRFSSSIPLRIRPSKRTGSAAGGGGGVKQQQCTSELNKLFQCWKSNSVDAPACSALATQLTECLSRLEPSELPDYHRLNRYLDRVYRSGI